MPKAKNGKAPAFRRNTAPAPAPAPAPAVPPAPVPTGALGAVNQAPPAPPARNAAAEALAAFVTTVVASLGGISAAAREAMKAAGLRPGKEHKAARSEWAKTARKALEDAGVNPVTAKTTVSREMQSAGLGINAKPKGGRKTVPTQASVEAVAKAIEGFRLIFGAQNDALFRASVSPAFDMLAAEAAEAAEAA